MYLMSSCSSPQECFPPILMRQSAYNPNRETLEMYYSRNEKRVKLSNDAKLSNDVVQRIINDGNMSMEELINLENC